MAMNKAEQQRMRDLEREVRLGRALTWTPPVERDLPIPKEGRTSGWDYNTYTREVFESWSGTVWHGDGATEGRSASQGGRALYSTKRLALKALRNAMELRAARELADVDLQLDQIDAKGEEESNG